MKKERYITVFHATDQNVAWGIKNNLFSLIHAYLKGCTTANLTTKPMEFMHFGRVSLEYLVPENSLLEVDFSSWYTSSDNLSRNEWSQVGMSYRHEMAAAGLIANVNDVASWTENLVINRLSNKYFVAVHTLAQIYLYK